MSLYLFAYLVLIIAPMSTLIHELGHAFGAKLVQADRIKLSLGIGKRQWAIACKDFQIIIYSVYFIGGVTESERDRPYTRSEMIWITLLGPVFNIVAAMIVFIIHGWNQNGFLQLLFWFNLWMATVNLIPFKFKGKQTDGFTIFKRIRSN